jgi:A/G-specific adenine glycosylase
VSDRRSSLPTDLDQLLFNSRIGWLPRRLLAWFARHRRDLPWRRDRDPYRIWISEVMLQQTQVVTVIPFFLRFIAALPSISHLAAADEQDVLRLWEGLGYYRRARDLHASAKRFVAEHGGRIPDNAVVVSQLPGFGRYTCNAVLSQAFDRRLPILEANSQRVLSRLLGWSEDPRQGPARQRLWRAAEALLPRKHIGEFNQSLMELGALVCTPAAPSCAQCPLADRCVARQLGLQEKIPARTPAAKTVSVQEVGVVIRQGDKVMLVQRPAEGRWASLWEVPHGPVQKGESIEAAVLRVVVEMTGLKVDPGTEVLTIRHAVTRFRITMLCIDANHRGGRFWSDFYRQAAWVAPGKLAAYPLSRPQRKLAEILNAPHRQGMLF